MYGITPVTTSTVHIHSILDSVYDAFIEWSNNCLVN